MPQAAKFQENRILLFDVLRIFAICAVVLLHVTAEIWWDYRPSINWYISTIYMSLVRWGVPIFIMISGALFLNSNKQVSIKKLYTKNIARIIFAYIFWATIYAISPNISVNHFIGRIIQGPFHFWFLKMLIGLYIIIPILRIITSNRKAEEYFLILSCITTYIMPLFDILDKWDIESAKIIRNFIESINIKMTLGFTSYFILGHYLYSYPPNKKIRIVIYLLAILSLLCVIVGTLKISNHLNCSEEIFFSNLMIFTLLESIAVFIFARNHFKHCISSHKKIIIELSNMSFGIYLVHVLIIRAVDTLGINAYSINPILSIPAISVSIFIFSYVLTKIISYIPLLNKFII